MAKLRKKMAEAMIDTKPKDTRKGSVIDIVENKPISTPFKTVARNSTIISKNTDTKHLDSVEMKYRPKFDLVD